MSGSSLNAASSQIQMQQSQIASAILGTKSVYQTTGSQALTPTARDETVYIAPANGVQTYAVWSAGIKVVYSLPKTATLIGKIYKEFTLSAGVTNPAYTPAVVQSFIPIAGNATGTAYVGPVGTPRAAYCQNFGDLIVAQTILRYGSTVLQQIDSDFEVAKRMLEKNNVNIEAINSEVLGNLTTGGTTELIRVDAFYNGITVRKPCEFLFWTTSQDRHWMPEALALEGTVEFVLRGPGEVIYTSTGDSTVITTMPTITNLQLRYQQITLSAAEKMNRLAIYKSPEGLVNLFHDLEVQSAYQFTSTLAAGQPLTVNVPLSNFRMDMIELIFFVRVAANTNAVGAGFFGTYNGGTLQLWSGDRMCSDRTNASVVTLNAAGCLLPITSAKLQAAGKDLFNHEPEFYIRAEDRKQYHPDSQVGNLVYHRSFAIYPEDPKNATGHASASVLGNLTLQIVMPSPGTNYTLQCDVFSKSWNIMQTRAGSIAKALQ
jgi:hypothetical protein